MPQELLFELNGARVTPHIATFGGTSYQIANIASVHVARRKKYNPLAVIIFLLGLGILAAAIYEMIDKKICCSANVQTRTLFVRLYVFSTRTYSSAMKGAQFVWDKEKLDRFIAKPVRLCPATT
jgi:Family of unknown function (DUF6232)